MRSRKRRLPLRRALLAVIVVGWIAGGLIGTYSYLENYYLHRGFATPVRLARAAAGRLLTVHFYSPALHRLADYLVYLPAGYSRAHRYPVFYLLHGMPGRPVSYTVIGHIEVRLQNLISQGRVSPMILVFPDGRINGSQFSDSEWANTSAGRFDSYVVDVVHDVDERFAALADRQDRVIAGLSAGGYGAINIALHHLNVFGSVQVWSGYFTQTRSGVFAHASRAQLADNSPIDYVKRLRATLAVYPLRAFLYVGRADPATPQLVPMARALRAAGAHVRYAIYAGGHDWQLWNAHLDQMLILAGREVRQPLGHPASPGVLAPAGALDAFRRPGHHQRVRARTSSPTAGAQFVGTPSTAIPTNRFRSAAPAGDRGKLYLGLILALASAGAINVGFMLLQRGLTAGGAQRARGPVWLPSVLRSRSWLGGQALGWLGFAAQIVALSIAPLSLVQAFVAGGLALSVPVAARAFGHRVSRTQWLAVLLAAAALAALPIGVSRGADHVDIGPLLGLVACAVAIAAPTGLAARAASLRAIAAGLLYGVADAAIKAAFVAVDSSATRILAWAALAVLVTLGGFLAFQAALRAGNAVAAISLMNALTALVALACGVLGLGESLGRGAGLIAAHLLAVGAVIACVPLLATAQTKTANAGERGGRQPVPAAAPVRFLLAAAHPRRERAAGGEQQPLKPRTGTGGACP